MPSIESTNTKETYFIQDKKQVDSFAFSQMSDSPDQVTMLKPAKKRMQRFAEDNDHCSSTSQRSTKSYRSTRSRGSTKSSRSRARRKRGESLERLISQLILGTASAGATEAHFEVGKGSSPATVNRASVDYILQDLVHTDGNEQTPRTTPTELPSRRSNAETYINTIKDKLREANHHHQVELDPSLSSEPTLRLNIDFAPSSTVKNESRPSHHPGTTEEYEDPTLEMNFSEGEEEHDLTKQHPNANQFGKDFDPIEESFESVEWKAVALNPILGGTTRSFSPAFSEPSFGSPSPTPMITPPHQWSEREDPPTSARERATRNVPRQPILPPEEIQPIPAKGDERQFKLQPKREKEEVVFKKNFEDWTPFEAMEFSHSEDLRFSDTLVDPKEFVPSSPVDEDGFFIAQSPGKRKRTVDVRSGWNAVQAPYGLQGRRSYKFRSFESVHPHSPDSVFDHPSSASHASRNGRSDPPGAHDLQFPEDERFTRISI